MALTRVFRWPRLRSLTLALTLVALLAVPALTTSVSAQHVEEEAGHHTTSSSGDRPQFSIVVLVPHTVQSAPAVSAEPPEQISVSAIVQEATGTGNVRFDSREFRPLAQGVAPIALLLPAVQAVRD
jgi:hypothetical protein